EAEAAETIAQYLFARLRRDALQMPQRRLVVAQPVDALLGEVADANRARRVHGTGQRRQVADQRADQRALAGAVAPEHADPCTTADRQVHVAQDRGLAVAGRQILGDQQRIGTVADFVQFDVDAAKRAHRRDLDDPLELLDPALRLARLR